MTDNATVASGDFDEALPEPDGEQSAEGDVDVVEGEIVEPAHLEPADLGLLLPDEPEAARDMLLVHLAQSRVEADEYLGTLQRVAADFDNYRRRVERDQSETVARAAQRVVEALLPSIDAFEAALAYRPRTAGEEKIMEGLRRAHDQLMETLRREGLEPIASAGEPFDPAIHEAVSGGGDGDLVVTADLRRGYTLKGRVIRPALVSVGHGD